MPANGLRFLFAALPCTPGVLFLVAGLLRDPHVGHLLSNPDSSSSTAVATVQAHQLYLAGGAVLVAGGVLWALILWRIAHPVPDEAEGENED